MSNSKREIEEDLQAKPISSVVKKMKKDYDNSNKKDWKVISSTDKNGNMDTFITNKPNAYWLKSKELSPYSSLSIGSIVRNIDKDIDDQIGKKLSPDDMLRLFGMMVPIQNNQKIFAAGIEKYSQNHGNHLKKVIGERDPNLDYQMARKIDEEFTKKHPQRKNLYI